jgi:hypothetical protein
MPDDFIVVAETEKVILSAPNGNSQKATERVYTNQRTYSTMSEAQRNIIKFNTAEQLSLF